MREIAARVAIALCVIALSLSWTPMPVDASNELLPLHVEGNRLIDSSGRPVTLHGVDHTGTEYTCAQDLGIFAVPVDAAAVLAVRSWRANAVRVPLNEHCWLGVDDGVPTPQFIGEAYRLAIASYVDLLIANRLYVILDLHWSAPAGQRADGQRPMPNTSYSALFWTSVADEFKNDGRVIFDLFNEPVPNTNANDANDDAARRSWECWRDGGAASCDATLGLGNPATTMNAGDTVGMQALVDAVRATGATNVIMLGGIQFANTLWSSATRNWVVYRPNDPGANLVASVHIYPGNWCTDVSCYDTEIAPIAAQVPVVVGELGIAGCDTPTTSWLVTVMSWLDQKGAGYLAWTWDTPHSGHDPCTVVKLLLGYDGTPTPYGQIVKSHLAGLPVETTATLTSSSTRSSEGDAVTFSTTIAAVFGSDIPTGSASFAVDGRSQTATLDAAGRASITVSFPDDGLHPVVARYLGAAGFQSSPTVALTQPVENVPPNVGTIAGATEPVAVGTLVTISASFADLGVADSHAATLDWGDGTTSPASLTEQGGSGSFTGSHAYAAAGIYRLSAVVTDDDGGKGQSAPLAVVVFDPAAGSARGAGWFQSPPGADASDQTATGRATFGFLARYPKAATEPITHPGLRLKTSRFEFESTSYDWLVITGAKAQLRGAGRLDGSGSYGFFVSVIDGQAPAGSGSDLLRIKIWDSATGAIVYDTQSGAPDGADPVTALAGGSIAVGSGR